MAYFQRAVFVLSVLAAVGAEPQGNNEYLPPDKGYSYNKPSVPFPSSPQRPSTQYTPPAPQQPNNQYRPSSPAPRPQSPTFGSTQPAYRPQPSPAPFSPQPSYRPPQQTFRPQQNPQSTYRPPQPTYGPPQTQNTFRPTQQNNPIRPGGGPYPAPAGSSDDHSHAHGDHVHEAGMPYDFNYAVKDDTYGTDFSQNEVSDGDQVKGEYRVQLPDGRLQIVRYTADWKTGFHADVSYEGEAKYPDFVPGASRPGSTIADRPNSGYNYPRPGQANPPTSYGPPSTGSY